MGFQSCSEYVFSGMLLPFDPSTIDAKDDVMTTFLTLGALFFMDLSTPIFCRQLIAPRAVELLDNMPVVPMIAGSKRSFLVSVILKWNYKHLASPTSKHHIQLRTGEAVWITASNGGSEMTALSKAPSWAISSTIAKSSLLFGVFRWASLILSAFSWDRTVVTTEWPWSRRTSRTWAAIKPLPPWKTFSNQYFQPFCFLPPASFVLFLFWILSEVYNSPVSKTLVILVLRGLQLMARIWEWLMNWKYLGICRDIGEDRSHLS